MNTSNGVQTLNPQSLNIFNEAISLILSRWTALQLVVQNQCGGRDSFQKPHDLASNILNWFVKYKGSLYIDDLEDELYKFVLDNFNAEFQDDSVEEVAEHLMIIHEDCLNGDYRSVEKLRVSAPGTSAVSQSQRVINDNEDESSDDEEETSDMMVDEPVMPEIVACSPKQKPVPDEEGFIPVIHKKSKGKRSA